MRKIFNDEFNVTLENFTDGNDQLSYFVKTLNIAKESFIPRRKCFINSRNHIKLDKTAKSKIRKKKQILWKQYLKTKDTKTYTEFRRTSNQLRHLTRNSNKKRKNISDPKLTQKVFRNM